jgi:amidohydrolase
MNLIKDIVDRHDEMVQWRRDFHLHPELAHQETDTARKVAEILRSFRMDEIEEQVGSTGVVGVLRNGAGPVIGLRADMDALPVSDAGEHDHRSTVEGVSHACGHDGHIAMLLAAGRYLAASRNFRGTVVFIFQPAEEIANGALSMIEHGLLEKYPMESVYALHIIPALAVGRMAITPGPLMAAINNFKINVTGQGGHVGLPHLAKNPVIAGAGIVSALLTIAPCDTDPIEPVVVSVTSFQSCTDNYNVIPGSVEIKGTARYMNTEYEDVLPERIGLLANSIASGYGVTAELDYFKGSPPLVNSEREAQFAAAIAGSLLGETNVVRWAPLMGGEDFSLFLKKIPGVLAFIGNGEDSPLLHNPAFDFNDEVLPIGASYFARLVEATLPP